MDGLDFLLISTPSTLFSRPLVTVLSAPTMIGITITFMFHSLQLSSKIRIFVRLFAFFYFLSIVHWNAQIHFMARSFFSSMINAKCVLQVRIRWFADISKLQSILCVSFSKKTSRLYMLICQHGQVLISCTIPRGLPFPPSHAYSCISFVLVCSIRLLIDCFFSINNKTSICHPPMSKQVLLSHNKIFWHYFQL